MSPDSLHNVAFGANVFNISRLFAQESFGNDLHGVYFLVGSILDLEYLAKGAHANDFEELKVFGKDKAIISKGLRIWIVGRDGVISR